MACMTGRNEYARRLDVIETPGEPVELKISGSAASRSGGSSWSRFTNTIQPVLQSKPGPQLWPSHFGSAGWLLTVILFALTLTSFHWRDIALGGVAALGLIVARFVGKLSGVLIFAKPSGLNWKQGAALGVALTPMSALAYLLVDDMYVLYPDYDPTLRAIVMCSIVVLQLVGPWLVYRSLALVGERRE